MGVAAFAGPSGAGKSTTAALLSSLGYQLVADDILPVTFNQNLVPGVWPYLRRLKLRREPIAELAFTPTETVSEAFDNEKYFVYPKHAANDEWSRLERLYLLEIDPTCADVSIPDHRRRGGWCINGPDLSFQFYSWQWTGSRPSGALRVSSLQDPDLSPTPAAIRSCRREASLPHSVAR